MKILGLTGGIASGKSTVSQELDRLGALVISSDIIAHQQMETGSRVWHELVKHFGEGILNEQRSIDRAVLGEIVFNDSNALMLLNDIIHPGVIGEIRKLLRIIRDHNPKQDVVLEIPLLFEIGLQEAFDEVWTVWVDREEQITRLMQRNNLSEAEAKARLTAQIELDAKADLADRIIDNSRELDYTMFQVRKAYQDFQNLMFVKNKTFWEY